MRLEDFDLKWQKDLIPHHESDVVYECIGCGRTYPLEKFLYVCPACKSLLDLKDNNFDQLKAIPGDRWQRIFDYRKLLNEPAGLKGIFLFHELILPFIPLDEIIYLGEGHTPIVAANQDLSQLIGANFSIKYDGLNPSASFKDRGMASVVSFINFYLKHKCTDNVLGICASTGDTSAAAALYLAYLDHNRVKSAVLLPSGKVTPQQLSQPLGSGAKVIEIPGVFDDCMKLVEELSENYDVFLLNSKNSLRIVGQKSYSFEIAQQLDYKTDNLTLLVPIGNAGNITAIMQGFLDLQELGIINKLPKIIGVQSIHANPVYNWYKEGNYNPVKVKPSVAQAAMIGNPVSFPRVNKLVKNYYKEQFMAVQVSEQEIIESMLLANRHGHVICTQGGETVAGLKRVIEDGLLSVDDTIIVKSTSHQLKFAGFQQMFFDSSFPDEYHIKSKDELKNIPIPLSASAKEIAEYLGLTSTSK